MIADFFSGKLPEKMQGETYHALKNEYQIVSGNIDAIVRNLNDNLFTDRGRKDPEALKKYLITAIASKPNNASYYKKNLENLSKYEKEKNSLLQEIKKYCRCQLNEVNEKEKRTHTYHTHSLGSEWQEMDLLGVNSKSEKKEKEKEKEK